MAVAPLISFEEFERLDTDADEAELLCGELLRTEPNTARHMKISERLFLRLDMAVEPLRIERSDLPIGEAHFRMGYLLGTEPRSRLRPDVSITHRDQPEERFYLGAPLLVFEIVSESDTAAHLESKIAAYLSTGAAEVWVVYPDSGHAWVHYSSSRTARLETESITSELLPGAAIPLREIL